MTRPAFCLLSSSSFSPASAPSSSSPAQPDESAAVHSSPEWGPTAVATTSALTHYGRFDIPLAPFSRAERPGRVADWTAPGQYTGGKQHYHSGGMAAAGGRMQGAHAVNSFFAPSAFSSVGKPEEDDGANWTTLAETRTSSSTQRKFTKSQPFRGGGMMGNRGGRRNDAGGNRFGFGRGGGVRRIGWGQRNLDRHQKSREPSVRVGPTWKMLEEIEFSRLAKLQFDPDDPLEVCSVGSLRMYDRTADKVTTKTERMVSIEDVSVPKQLSISEDPVFKELEARGEAVIFTTDVIASLLMACSRTLNPWDVVVRRSGKCLYIDKRDESAIDLVLVNETAVESPSDDREQFNSASNLSVEASRINTILPLQLSRADDLIVGAGASNAAEPLLSASSIKPPEGMAYRYMRWSMGDDMTFIIRSEINGVTKLPNSPSPLMLSIRALLEYDPKASSIDWRQRLDNQRGAVLAGEIKNNTGLLARWVFQAILSQVDMLKIAYVSRISPKDRIRHARLGVQEYEPADLATQMNLDVPNGFGILKALTDLCRKLSESQEYIIMRDPNKTILRIYSAFGEQQLDAFTEQEALAFEQDVEEELLLAEDLQD